MRGRWAETWDDGPLDGVIAPPSIMYGSSYFVARGETVTMFTIPLSSGVKRRAEKVPHP
jgi:hypothetical protein